MTAHEVKFLADPPSAVTADGLFSGYASLFDVPDLGRDVVAPGAFAQSLAVRGAAAVRMLWQHDPAEPVGRWLSLVEDRRGLAVRGRLNLGVARAREIGALLAEGAIDGLSIGFRVVEAERARPGGGRRLLRLDLWEISVVTFPMLPGARVGAGLTSPDLPLAGKWERSSGRGSGRPGEGDRAGASLNATALSGSRSPSPRSACRPTRPSPIRERERVELTRAIRRAALRIQP